MNLYIRRKKERKVSMLVILLFFISIFSGCIWGKFPKTVYAAGNRIVIDSYNIEKGDFTLGSTATIAFKLKNIGGSVNMKNIYIQMSSNSGITPVYGESNQKYVDMLDAGRTVEVVFKVDVPTTIETEKAEVMLKIEYENAKGEDKSNQATVYIPIKNTGELEINNVSVADSAKVGAKTLISVSYANGSDITLRDAVIKIEGNIEDEGTSVELGNIETGISKYKDMYVIFTKTGEQPVELTISYKDAEGKTITKEVCNETVNVMAADQVIEDTDDNTQVQTNDKLKKNILKILVLFAIVGVCVGIFRDWKKRE